MVLLLVYHLDQLIYKIMMNLMKNMMHHFDYFHFFPQLIRLKNKVQHKIIKQEYHHVLYELKEFDWNIFFFFFFFQFLSIYHDMLIEQAFDKHFSMIPLRIDHPILFSISKTFVFCFFNINLKTY
jgi:hypothetical protein